MKVSYTIAIDVILEGDEQLTISGEEWTVHPMGPKVVIVTKMVSLDQAGDVLIRSPVVFEPPGQ